ncbi:TPA: DNA repair protein RecO [Candidatus Poribacteria bacterium]|nr:DNA repair protein RecO [Candidatus Poribacteria bacterium]
MSLKRSNAIVIGHYSLGEADKIIVFFTRDYGKVRAVARGAKRLKNRLSGRTEIFTYGDLIYFERVGKDLHTINSFDIIESFQKIKEDLLKMAYCSYIADLIQHVTPESEPDPDTFDLMLSAMYLIESTADAEMVVRAFEIRLLERIGLNPRLDSCIICSGEINDNTPKFSIQSGGVICGKCAKLGHHAFNISYESLEIMRKMANIPLEVIPSLNILESNRQEIKKILMGFLSFHVDMKNLRSLGFLESMEKDKF